MFKATVVGWCIEWLQAAFLIWDDIMDESVTRRGQPCWYKQGDVKMNAINDGLVLECQIYSMLKRHCKSLPCYADLLDLFHEVTHQTASGQLIDLITAPIGVVDLSKYTEEAYMRIVTYKTAFYTFYLPAASAMHLSGITDPAASRQGERHLHQAGQFFQIQDDYLDCYGDPAVIGKIGTDIMDNKCGWLVVQALKRCTPEQKRSSRRTTARRMPSARSESRRSTSRSRWKQSTKSTRRRRTELRAIIESKDNTLPPELFGAMLKKIYKRSK